MGKAAAPKKRQTTLKKTVPTVDYTGMFDPRSRLITSMGSLGWRMAVMIFIPLLIGIKLDQHFGTKPSYTLTAFFVAIAGCSYLIYKEYKEINAEMAESFAPSNTKKRPARQKKEVKP